MSSVASTVQAALYPLPAFYFKVVFAALPGADTSFQEVRGIGAEMDFEEIKEGGENRFIHRLPGRVRHPQLELKRAIAPYLSPLVTWCRLTLETGYATQISTTLVNVYLLDELGIPVRAWSFANAYPTKWEVDDFKSTKNDVAIETIVLSYTYSNRIL